MSANPQDEQAFHVLKIFESFRRKRPTGAIFGKRAVARIGSGASPPLPIQLRRFFPVFHEVFQPLLRLSDFV